MTQTSPRVGLFVTCLVDLIRPSIGFAAVKLLEDAGCTVEVPEAQTCCGQPAFNAGDRNTAADLARNVIAAFKGYDYVVAPSGSCGGMIVKHYPELFAEGSRRPRGRRRPRVAQPRTRLVPHAGDEGDGGRCEVPGQGHLS